MASMRTTYRGVQGPDGTSPSGRPFVWVSLRDPSLRELTAVRAEFGLPGPLVDGMATAATRSSLEVAGELLVAVVKTASWVAAEETVRLGGVQLVPGDGFVVSVDRDTAVLDRVRHDLQVDPELAGVGPAAVLPSVVDHAVDGYGPVLGAITTWSRRSRRRSSSPGGRGRPSAATSCRGRPTRPRCRCRQNDDMRRISAWVAIWAVPTLLVGIYGMNLRYLPELEWRVGDPLVLATMAVICLALYRAFRRSGWLLPRWWRERRPRVGSGGRSRCKPRPVRA